MLGVTEDEVLVRQRAGALPGRLTWNRLGPGALDEFAGPP